MTEPTHKKKRPWLKEIHLRANRVINAANDRWVQRRFGTFKDQKAETIAQVKAVPGGRELLRSAHKTHTKISVVSPRRIDGVKGRFGARKGRPRLRVSSIGDIPRMVSTLWHELRHLQQHVARGDLEGGTSRLLDTRRSHFLSIMHEADAYTLQTLMCLHQKKLGKPQYLEGFLARESDAVKRIKSFLDKTPYESFPSDASFARALFADVAGHGLVRYHRQYFDSYRSAFKKMADVKTFREKTVTKKPIPDYTASADLMSLYGHGATSSAALTRLATAFYRAQTPDVRETLTLIENTVKNAGSLTQEQFAEARAEILDRTKALSKKFDTRPIWPVRVVKKWLHPEL